MKEREGTTRDGTLQTLNPVATSVAAAVLLSTACSGTGPQAPAVKDSSMTPEQSRENVMNIFRPV